MTYDSADNLWWFFTHSQKTRSDHILPSGLSSPDTAEGHNDLRVMKLRVKKKIHHLLKKKGASRRKKRQGEAKREREHRCSSSASASLFVLGKLVLSNKVSLY